MRFSVGHRASSFVYCLRLDARSSRTFRDLYDRCPNSHNVQKAVRNVAEFEFEHTGCVHPGQPAWICTN